MSKRFQNLIAKIQELDMSRVSDEGLDLMRDLCDRLNAECGRSGDYLLGSLASQFASHIDMELQSREAPLDAIQLDAIDEMGVDPTLPFYMGAIH